ncbi:cupin domain-containing protein [Algihabitans albus]|uniref:cupin domain-containing protein n=1 Tax=Algihabitans albus TaxID=2164067 RepID=UPI002E256F4D
MAWCDEKTGFVRRAVSPPGSGLAAEVLECELKADTCLAYDLPPVPGLEHHLVLLEGDLEVSVEGQRHNLTAGDCLRYQLFGSTEFRTGKQTFARYILVLI